MKSIDRIKLSKEIYDTVLHRKCVLRSGLYLATYLKHHGEKELADQLIERCLVHDISKLEDTREFAALASIIDQSEDMKNVTHELTDRQKEMISLHWAHNSHHPEHYPSANDMTQLDLLEMACDLHARSKQWHTNSLEFLNSQQNIRFHFDEEHFKMLSRYLVVLEFLTIHDGYLDIFNNDISFLFKSKDPIVSHLEDFSDTSYLNRIETERLILTKSHKSDFSAIYYMIKLKENEKTIGELSILCNGKIYYRIPRAYRDKDYIKEALLKFKDIVKRKELSIEIGKTNLLEQQMADELGFVSTEDSLEGIRTYKFIRN